MKQNSNAYKRKQKKARERASRAKRRVLSKRKKIRDEAREKHEVWKINRAGEKINNRLISSLKKEKEEEKE